jgi:hypothetical protein
MRGFSTDIWALKHSKHLITSHNHISAFLAASKIGNKLVQQTDDSTLIDYGNKDD